MKNIFIICLTISYIFASVYKEGDFIRQKADIKKLKQELDEFYKIKSKEYEEQKVKLKKLLSDIKKQKQEIEKIRQENKQLLQEIKGEVISKTIKIYNKAKPKVVASIFTQMIKDGKIEDVFDIIIKMKNKNVTNLLKFLQPEDASILTNKLIRYKEKQNGRRN